MFNPEMVHDAVDALEAAGYITVSKDVNGDLLISAAPKLVRLIEECGVTLPNLVDHRT